MSPAPNPSQEFVPIQEIRDGVVILANGSMRMILLATSINFALKSYDEQTAILLQYQNFLNSLDFPLQIVVQSRELDIQPYVHLLEDRLKEQTNDLLKIQVREYIDFVRNLTETTDIMTKSFFVVIPYDRPALTLKKGFLGGLLPGGKKTAAAASDDFAEYRNQLEQRINVVTQGVGAIGIRVKALGTEELVELFFKTMNPGETDVPLVNPAS